MKTREEAKKNEEEANRRKEEVDSAERLVQMKASGFQRPNPQTQAQVFKTPAVQTTPSYYKCDICKLMRDSKEMLDRHMKNHTEDGDWTCDGCAYQSISKDGLVNHLLEKRDHSSVLLEHLLEKEVFNKKEKCKLCPEEFSTRDELKTHMKRNHRTFKPCRNGDSCTWGEDCIFNHTPVREGCFLCFDCGEEFKSKYDVMVHRKNNHRTGPCKNMQNGVCNFGDRCFYSHDNLSRHRRRSQEQQGAAAATPEAMHTDQVDFQQHQQNLAPPSPPQIGHMVASNDCLV